MDNIDPKVIAALKELELRKKRYPHRFYEPANPKVEAFHKSEAKVKALFGANRSSKTESAMMEAVFMMVGESPYRQVKPAPTYGRIVVVDFNQLEKVVNEKLMRMIPPELFIDGKWEKSYNQKSHIITLRNGSKVDLMTHEQPVLSFEGSSRDWTVFDEEPPKDIYTSCLMRHVDTNGVAILSLTPLNGLTYLYKDVYLASMTNPNIDSWVMSIYENRYLTAESIAAVENLIVDEIDREIRLYGKFVSRSGMVFNHFDPEVHVYDPTDSVYDSWDSMYPPRTWLHFVGIDPGWGHPTGVVWCAFDPSSEDIWVYAEHKQGGQDPKYHSDVIHATNRQIGIRRPIYVIDSQAKATDQSSGSSVAKTYAKYGIPCRFGTKKLIDGNMLINTLMTVNTHGKIRRSKLHISKECPELIGEIGEYQRAPATTLQNKERFIDKNNDLIAALRYAVWEANKFSYEDVEDYFEERGKEFRKQPERRKALTSGY